MIAIENQLDEARALIEESLTAASQIAHRSVLRSGLLCLAIVAGARGDWQLAARLEASVESEVTIEQAATEVLMR